jgi:hypothetical protein
MTKGLVRIITATTLLTLTFTAAHGARQWQHLGTEGKNNYFFYDKKTTTRQGDIVSGWVTKQFNVDEKAMKEEKVPLNQYHGETWTLAFYEFDCKQNTMRALVGRENLRGKSISDVAKEEFRPVQPKTLDEALLKAICREVPEKKTPEAAVK